MVLIRANYGDRFDKYRMYITRKRNPTSAICKDTQCDVLCVQKTYRDQNMNTPKIDGMRFVNIIYHKKHGSAIFIKNITAIKSMQIHGIRDMEVLTIDLGIILISLIYKPPNTTFNPTRIFSQNVQ